MSFVVAAIGGAALSGGLNYLAGRKQASAANNAAQMSTAEQARQFDINQQNQKPFLQAGYNALAAYQNQLGLTQPAPDATGRWAPLLNAAHQLTGATTTGTGQQAFNETLPQFSFDASKLATDPAYKFAYDQAMQATNRNMNAGGFSNSGNILTALQDRASGLASQQYQNAFNNALEKYNIGMQQYNTKYGQYQDYLNRLAAISGVGQTSANQMGASGANYANAFSNIQQNNANAQANAANQFYGGTNQAINQGLSNYYGYQQNQQLMNMLSAPNPNTFYSWG